MSALSIALDRLRQLLDEEHLIADTGGLSRYLLDGQTPAAVAFPGTAQEAAAVLRAAAEAGLSVLLRGAGHHLYLGAPASAIGLVLCLTRLNAIVEYDPGDLTITAQAGISLAALRQVVGAEGQLLPLDPPGPDTATLGGIVAANLSGPMRMKHGAARDLALGMRVALTSGEVIRTGGRTVKNVAGYDLTKLFAGSLGTLGAILEVTLRLVPAPEAQAVMLAPLAPAQATEVGSRIAGFPWELTACEALSPLAAARLRPYLPASETPGMGAICVGLGGSQETVSRQRREISSLLGNKAVCIEGGDAHRVWERVRAMIWPADGSDVLARGSVPLTAVGEMMALASSSGWAALAHAGDGIIYAWPGGKRDMPTAAKTALALRQACERVGGWCVLESGPVELKREIGVWGPALANADLMRKLKLAYDPAGVLGCDRLL